MPDEQRKLGDRGCLHDALLGVWRLRSITSRGESVSTNFTHLVLAEDACWYVVPGHIDYEGDARVVTTWRLHESREPAVITQRDRRLEPDGTSVPLWKHTGLVELRGDTLAIAWGDFEEPSESLQISDEDARLELYERETDAAVVEQHRRPPEPVAPRTRADAFFGELRWNENFGWWQTELSIVADRRVAVRIDAPEDEPSRQLARGREVVTALRGRALRRTYACIDRCLRRLYNQTWRDEDAPKLSKRAFLARLSLDAVDVHEDGTAELYVNDGDLFGGHVILVWLSERMEPTDATLAG